MRTAVLLFVCLAFVDHTCGEHRAIKHRSDDELETTAKALATLLMAFIPATPVPKSYGGLLLDSYRVSERREHATRLAPIQMKKRKKEKKNIENAVNHDETGEKDVKVEETKELKSGRGEKQSDLVVQKDPFHDSFRNPKFWAEVAKEIPTYLSAPELSRFKQFCMGLMSKPAFKKVVPESGQWLNDCFIFPGLDDDAGRHPFPAEQYDELREIKERLENEVLPVAKAELGKTLEEKPLKSDDASAEEPEENGQGWYSNGWDGWQFVSLRGAQGNMPETARALRSAMRNYKHIRPSYCGIARLKAKCSGELHSDYRNYQFSCILPIVAPPGCGIVVNGTEQKVTQDGPCVIVDHTFPHYPYNNGTSDRFVMLADAWHPGLTQPEREALATLFAIKDRFDLLEMGLKPWGHGDEDLKIAKDAGAEENVAFWKDPIGYMDEHRGHSSELATEVA